MSGEFNPYTPPETGVPPRGIDVAEGRLWMVEGGRLFVRDRASLPDVCVLGTVGEKGARSSQAISAVPRWMRLLPFIPLLWHYFSDSRSLGLFIAALVIAVMLPLVMAKMGKSLRVMVFQSRRRERLLWVARNGIGVVMIVCAMRAGDPFVEAGLLSESASDLLFFALVFGVVFITNLLPLHAWSGAAATGDGWFELKGVRAAVIERLADIQQRVGRTL